MLVFKFSYLFYCLTIVMCLPIMLILVPTYVFNLDHFNYGVLKTYNIESKLEHFIKINVTPHKGINPKKNEGIKLLLHNI